MLSPKLKSRIAGKEFVAPLITNLINIGDLLDESTGEARRLNFEDFYGLLGGSYDETGQFELPTSVPAPSLRYDHVL